MSPYQSKRAEQKARDALKTAGAMKLHRIVDLEADDFCAPEGCYVAPHPMDENQGHGPIKKAPRVPRKRQPIWVVLVAVGAIFAALAAIHFGAPR